MLSIDGHTLYRLNYPLRLNKWYHSCQSWNGHTGEWQIWVNDERVGRGFNNRVSLLLKLITQNFVIGETKSTMSISLWSVILINCLTQAFQLFLVRVSNFA